MEGFVIAGVIVGLIAALRHCVVKFSDNDDYRWLVAAAVIVVIGLGLIFNAVIAENNRGPCVQYETQWHYNAATKTTMPAKVCVNRGEWVDQ